MNTKKDGVLVVKVPKEAPGWNPVKKKEEEEEEDQETQTVKTPSKKRRRKKKKQGKRVIGANTPRFKQYNY